MIFVRSLLMAVAVFATLSASFSKAQSCCGGASYTTAGSFDPATADAVAEDAGCGSYTVMCTRTRIVYDTCEETRYRNCYRTVWETVQVPVCRTVRETCYRDKTYTVRRPVRETTYKTCCYTVRRPVTENYTKTINYTVRCPVKEMKQRTV